MPEGLTQTKTPTFSETRPEIDRNGGRLHFKDSPFEPAIIGKFDFHRSSF
jgi:hypothetical protein